jgi:hypothetical protein
LAIADYCGTENAALTWAYEGRETEDEQRIYGSLHRDVPFQLNHKSEKIVPFKGKEIINHKLTQGTELGCFLFGGSDIVLFFEPGKAPHITPKTVKVGEKIA